MSIFTGSVHAAEAFCVGKNSVFPRLQQKECNQVAILEKLPRKKQDTSSEIC